MKRIKKGIIGLSLLAAGLLFVSCGTKDNTTATKSSSSEASTEAKEIVVGVAPGPYGEMVEKVIAPLILDKGFKLTTKEFNDYIQPNKALDSKQIDANLFQHTAYLEKFSADNSLDLAAIEKVPTLGMGIYSKKLKSIDDIQDGAKVAIANDPSNLARTLQLLQANDLITLKAEVDETKATVNDIEENKKNLDFKELDAAQLARSLDNVDIALVPGNFAWAASLKPEEALALEKLNENYKNVVAVRAEDKDSDLGKAFKEVLESEEFKTAIADSDFKDFDKPDFWNK